MFYIYHICIYLESFANRSGFMFYLLYCNILLKFCYNLRFFHNAGNTKVLCIIFSMVKIKYLCCLCFIFMIYACILNLSLIHQGLCFMFYIVTSFKVVLQPYIFFIIQLTPRFYILYYYGKEEYLFVLCSIFIIYAPRFIFYVL